MLVIITLGRFSFYLSKNYRIDSLKNYIKHKGECNTVELRSTDTRLIRTPGYCGQFRLFRRGKAHHTFSLKLTPLIRTPVNMDTLACPLGVLINRVPLQLEVGLKSLAVLCLIYCISKWYQKNSGLNGI